MNDEYVKLVSWNVEGLTELKTLEICLYMKEHDIDVACVQETWSSASTSYDADGGHRVMLSSQTGQDTGHTGVGFIVSPLAKKNVIKFIPVSGRTCSLTLKCRQGNLNLLGVYAPHNHRPEADKLAFYDELDSHWQRLPSFGLRLILGDLNARIGKQRPGEEEIVGDKGFGNEVTSRVEPANRDLLMEFCWSQQLLIANTFADVSDEEKVTYRELGVEPMRSVSATGFSVLDFYLLPWDRLNAMVSLRSDRYATLQSQHFPLTGAIRLHKIRRAKRQTSSQLDWSKLTDPETRKALAEKTQEKLSEGAYGKEGSWQELCDEALKSCKEVINEKQHKPNKPWISKRTLELVEHKRQARYAADWLEERRLRKEVRSSARRDRAIWLEELTATGDWNALRKVRKGTKHQQNRLRNSKGEVVPTDERAEVLATFLEESQWKIRDSTLECGVLALRETYNVNMQPFSYIELRKAITKMKSGKSCKQGDLPIDYFKALAQCPGQPLRHVLDFCNMCWYRKCVPMEWSVAAVAMLFKKGDSSLPENYRPISLQTVCHKLMMSMIKERLVEAGVEAGLWPSQFGFRSKCSTEDAIYIARRRIELAKAQRNGKISLLALDWAKAFDSLHVDALLDALRRFGLPQELLDFMGNVMESRQFYVQDDGQQSSLRQQRSGISQGCTLSPMLFVMAMSVLLHDATSTLSPGASNAYARGDLSDVVYADDTLLLGVSDEHLQEYLNAVVKAGKMYGMQMHFGKFQLLPINCNPAITVDGERQLETQSRMDYLGTVLSEDVHDTQELHKRIAIAKKDFISLQNIWRRSSLTWKRKIRIFEALVESKLLYSVRTSSMTLAQEKRLDAFQSKCLRQIIGIKPAYVSRVTNDEVLKKSEQVKASIQIRARQSKLLKKILRCPEGHPLRHASFCPGTDVPLTDRFVRRVGRPHREWVRTVATF